VSGEFDAGAYLRQVGQRALDDPEHEAGFPPGVRVVAASRALCAIHAIDPLDAQDIINEPLDRLVSGLGYSGGLAADLMDGPAQAQGPRPVTVRACPDELGFSTWRLYVHYAVFAQDHVGIEATAVGNLNHVRRLWPITISDDSGDIASGRFMGGGQLGTWRGSVITDGPLSPDTEWLELADRRVQVMPEAAPAPSFSPRQLGPKDPAERHLWLLASLFLSGMYGMHLEDHLEPAAQALVAAGALRPENALWRELRVLAEAFETPLKGDPPPGVGEPWASLCTRWPEKANRGLMGSVALGVVSDPFDGFRVRIDGLVSHREGFDLRVETSPGTPSDLHQASDAKLPPVVAWWAHDDLDNYYVGTLGSGMFARESSRGLVGYRPTLDSGAKVLELMPSGASSAVSLSVTLPSATD